MDTNIVKNFNKRWNIPSESNSIEEFDKFKTRIFNIFKDFNEFNYINSNLALEFCNILGLQISDYTDNLINAISRSRNNLSLYLVLEVFFNLNFTETVKEIYFKKVVDALNMSDVNLSIKRVNNKIIFYPRGEKILDEKLVDETISFLNTKSQEHFLDGLKNYQKNTITSRIKSAESLRRTIEEFIRFKLKNTKGLKENINDLLKKLKLGKNDPFIRNIVGQTFSLLDDYFNKNSKHNDGDINEEENEFLIYQVGLLCRYLNKLL